MTLCGILFFFCSCSLFADDIGMAKSSMPYLKKGVGARPSGMGNAFVAIADDATATYWNPAGLGVPDPDEVQVSSMFSKISFDRTYGFLSVTQQLKEDWGSFGISWYHFRIGQIESRDEDGNQLLNIDNLENTVIVSYGKNIGYNLNAGMNIKYYDQRLGGYKAWGIGSDFGILFQIFSFTRFGITVQDLNTGLLWNTGKRDLILPTFRFGVMQYFIYEVFLLSFDIEQTLKQKIITHIGSEYWINEYFAVRSGLNDLNFSAGASLKYGHYQFDYSWTLDNNALGDMHRFSLLAYF